MTAQSILERATRIRVSLQSQIQFGAHSDNAKSNASVCLGDAMTLLDKVSSSGDSHLLECAILRLARGAQHLQGFGPIWERATSLLGELKSK